MQKMHVDYADATTAPQFICPERVTVVAHYMKTTRVYVWFHHAGPRYAEDDLVRNPSPQNVVQVDFSSSDSDSSDSDYDNGGGGPDGFAGADVQVDHENSLQFPPDLSINLSFNSMRPSGRLRLRLEVGLQISSF